MTPARFTANCATVSTSEQPYGIFGNSVALFQRSVSTLPVGRADLMLLAPASSNSENALAPWTKAKGFSDKQIRKQDPGKPDSGKYRAHEHQPSHRHCGAMFCQLAGKCSRPHKCTQYKHPSPPLPNSARMRRWIGV